MRITEFFTMISLPTFKKSMPTTLDKRQLSVKLRLFIYSICLLPGVAFGQIREIGQTVSSVEKYKVDISERIVASRRSEKNALIYFESCRQLSCTRISKNGLSPEQLDEFNQSAGNGITSATRSPVELVPNFINVVHDVATMASEFSVTAAQLLKGTGNNAAICDSESLNQALRDISITKWVMKL